MKSTIDQVEFFQVGNVSPRWEGWHNVDDEVARIMTTRRRCRRRRRGLPSFGTTHPRRGAPRREAEDVRRRAEHRQDVTRIDASAEQEGQPEHRRAPTHGRGGNAEEY